MISNFYQTFFKKKLTIDNHWCNNHQKKISCLLIPKCASNSLRLMLDCDARLSPKSCDGYKTLTVIREPIDRYIAAFIEVMIPASDYPNGRYHHENLRIDKDLIRILDDINLSDASSTFISFTDLILERGFFEIHTKTQLHFLKGCGDISIYKLENLDRLMEDFAIREQIFENKTESSNIKKELLDLLETNTNLKNKVHKIFAKDIELYNSFMDKKQISL